MPEWNVLIPVIDLIDAPSAEDAVEVLKLRLRLAGFETYDHLFEELPPHYAQAFRTSD